MTDPRLAKGVCSSKVRKSLIKVECWHKVQSFQGAWKKKCGPGLAKLIKINLEIQGWYMFL